MLMSDPVCELMLAIENAIRNRDVLFGSRIDPTACVVPSPERTCFTSIQLLGH